MSYQKDRDEFVGVIVTEVLLTGGRCCATGDQQAAESLALARLILRNAATIQRLAIEYCHGGLTNDEWKQRTNAEQRITTACRAWKIKPDFQDDPRGACVKLILPSGRCNSWGGKEDGFCVPIR